MDDIDVTSNPEHLRLVRKAMFDVSNARTGTAYKSRIIDDKFRMAGKTGTTQKIIDGKYSNRHHVASFSGYFPADNPKVAITVVADEPKMDMGRLGYGGIVAAPSS